MKRALLVALSTGVLLAEMGRPDVVVFKNGARSEVQSFEIRDRAVHIVTLNGKKSSILRDAVDVEATLEANRRTPPPSEPETATPSEPKEPAPRIVARTSPPPPRIPSPRPPEPPPAAAPPPAPPRRESVPEVEPTRPRLAVYVNGAAGISPLDFAETERFELFKEEALVDRRYRDPKGRGVEIGGLVRLKGPLGVGAAVELCRRDREAAFDAFLPHPFFYERPRELAGSRTDLTHEEQALHLGATFSTGWGRRFYLDVGGGPSLFFARTEVLGELLYSETYPYDSVVPQGSESLVFHDRPWGYNFGASATYRVVGRFGLDVGVRFSRGRIRLEVSPDRTIAFDAGGFRANAGLRFLFP